MSARILDGKALAAEVRTKVAAEAARLTPLLKRPPGLAVVLVGENPASVVYVRNKARTTVELGMASFEHKLPAETSEADLLALIAKLNADPDRRRHSRAASVAGADRCLARARGRRSR